MIFKICHKIVNFLLQRNWVFATNSNFQVPISLQSDSVNLWYLKLRLFNLIHNLKYLRSAIFGSKDIGIRKSEFVAKTQFLWKLLRSGSKYYGKYFRFQNKNYHNFANNLLIFLWLTRKGRRFWYFAFNF